MVERYDGRAALAPAASVLRVCRSEESAMLRVSIAERIATLTLSRPPVNAINEEWVRLFCTTLDNLAGKKNWNILHLRSDQNVFCAGGDLQQMRDQVDSAGGPDRICGYAADMQKLYRRIEQLPQVTLAEIGGAAMGGGLELALACDLRIAGNDVKLGLPEARLGLIPGAGGTQRLTRLCGRAGAAPLLPRAEILPRPPAPPLRLLP